MSGKFGTPLARMHLENASFELVKPEPSVVALDPAEAAVLLVPDDPHAAIASTHQRAASAITGKVASTAVHRAFMRRIPAMRF